MPGDNVRLDSCVDRCRLGDARPLLGHGLTSITFALQTTYKRIARAAEERRGMSRALKEATEVVEEQRF
ncbi:MAG TPA: hypothetical protein VFB58_16805 [Chloroflexota bacterium]|nr:hypothetical protein [Chloroflexota bacterium]